MKPSTTRLAGIVIVGTLALALAACSSTSASTNSTGNHSVSNLNVGFFSPGTSNTYAATLTASALKEAKSSGIKLTNLSANFDSAIQVNQMQQALQRKTYNAWVVVPLDPNQDCPILEKAVAAGVKVMLANSPACTAFGPKGGIGIVGVQTLSLYQKWWDKILSDSKPGEIALQTGGALDYVTKIANQALKTEMKKHPGFTVISNQNLNYSTSSAYTNAQDLLKSHPNLALIASTYSGMTEGIVQATKQAGNTTVKVYDFDGDKTILADVKAGSVTLTAPGLPASEGSGAVKALVKAWKGKTVAKVTNPLESLKISGGPFITKANVDSYTPQY